jgi:hypothetical protein
MYVLMNKNRGIWTRDAFIPEIWESTVNFGDGTNIETALALFIDKQTAYVIKLKNNLDKDWYVLPFEKAIVPFGDKLSDTTIDMFKGVRFAFALGFYQNVENLAFYKRLVRLNELMSGHNWLKQIADDYPRVAAMVEADSECSHEKSEELATQVLKKYKNN